LLVAAVAELPGVAAAAQAAVLEVKEIPAVAEILVVVVVVQEQQAAMVAVVVAVAVAEEYYLVWVEVLLPVKLFFLKLIVLAKVDEVGVLVVARVLALSLVVLPDMMAVPVEAVIIPEVMDRVTVMLLAQEAAVAEVGEHLAVPAYQTLALVLQVEQVVKQ
jgi:hypothetical protein